MDISKHPVWVTYKDNRKIFFNAGGKGMTVSVDDGDRFKLQAVDLDAIPDSEIKPVSCTQDFDKNCDFYMSDNLRGIDGRNVMYACQICQIRKHIFELVKDWESGEYSNRTVEDAEHDKKLIISEILALEDFERDELCSRIDAVIKQRTAQ